MLDCFFAAPSRPLGEIEDITVDFGDSTQSYHVGEGSVAVPGLVAGLEEAHRRFGSVPWPQLVEPAIELAGRGLDATEAQRFLHLILAAVLQRDEGGRRIYGVSGRIETTDFVATLERLRDEGDGRRHRADSGARRRHGVLHGRRARAAARARSARSRS